MKEQEEEKKWEEFNIGHKTRPKRQRMEENNIIPESWMSRCKKMRRM